MSPFPLPPPFMRRLSLALSLSLLLPSIALAAYDTPSDLFSMIHDMSTGKSFSITAHGAREGTYVSVWANGSAQGEGLMMNMTTKATVDIVQGDMKIRAKAELMATGGMLYARLTSVDSSYLSDFGSFSAMLKQRQWIMVPMDEAMLNEVTGGMSLTGMAEMNADAFRIQATPGKSGGTIYSVTLNPDYAANIAMMLREMLGDETPVSSDFFPWRELAEGLHFDMTVFTDANDKFVSSTFSLSQSSIVSSFSVSGSEKAVGTVTVTAPKNALTIDQFINSLSGMPSDLEIFDMPVPADEPDMMEWEDTSFDSIDASASVMVGEDCSDQDAARDRKSVV